MEGIYLNYYFNVMRKFANEYEEAINEVVLAVSLYILTHLYNNNRLVFFTTYGLICIACAIVFNILFNRESIPTLLDTFYIKYFNYNTAKMITIITISVFLLDELSMVILPFLVVSCNIFLKPKWFGKELKD